MDRHRVLFAKAPRGYAAPEGALIQRVQRALARDGFDPGPLDGIYGRLTGETLAEWQRARRWEPHGEVDVATWTALVDPEVPPLFERALQITASFEGHGFDKVAGNFDGAGLTWGVIGFTLKHGEIGKVVRACEEQHPGLLGDTFGRLSARLLDVLERPLAEQLAFADEITVGRSRMGVLPEWRDAFAQFGAAPEVRALQLERASRYWDRALDDAERFGLRSELGLALCFDVAVQNGGVSVWEREAAWELLRRDPPTDERDVRVVLAHTVARGSHPRWVEDVRSRKRTIALGVGLVHGARYEVRTWGLDEYPAFEEPVDLGPRPSGGALSLQGSVGLRGENRPADVVAVKQRLVALGFSWLTPDEAAGPETIQAIRLFQAIKNGFDRVDNRKNDGLVEVGLDTHLWLKAANAPRWVQMPEGSPEEGYVNDEVRDTSDNHDYGTSWLAEAISAMGASYRRAYLSNHPGAALLHINDASVPQGGDTPHHAGHETGLVCDTRLPRKDGRVGDIDVDHPDYDRDAMRAMLVAFHEQPLADRAFLNDDALIREGLCRRVAGHHNHAHLEIVPPPRQSGG